MPTIKVQNLSKYFIDKKSRTALSALFDISLTIPHNSFVVIAGPSGSGKTTFLKTIAGLYTPDEGELFFDYLNVTEITANNRNLSYVSQKPALFPNKTIFDNIAYPLKAFKVPISEIRNRVNDIASSFNIVDLLSRKPKVLSGGQLQIVALAKALIKIPPILLLDEPFAALDPETTKNILNFLTTFTEKHQITTLLVTHNETNFLSYANLLVKIDNGSIQSVTTLKENNEQ